MEFDEMLAGLHAGKAEAKKEFAREYYPRMMNSAARGLARSRLKHTHTPNDICQTVWVAFFKQLARKTLHVENSDALHAYLAKFVKLTISAERAKSRMKKRDTRRLAAEPVEEHEVVSREPDPSAGLVYQELLGLALARLSPADQKALREHLKGKTWREIAKALGCNHHTLETRIHRALGPLAEKILREQDRD